MSRTITGSVEMTLTKQIDEVDCEFELEVRYRITPGSREHFCKATGSWDPPEPPECEVLNCLCFGVTFHNVQAYRVPIDTPCIQGNLGDFCSGTWEDDIIEKCYADAYERQGDEE